MKQLTQSPLFRPMSLAAGTLLLVVAFLVAAEMMQRLYRHHGWFPAFAHPGWRADPDGSFAEWWGYLLAVVAGLMLLLLYRRLESAVVLVSTAGLFFAIALDDMLQHHERGGGFLVRTFGLPEVAGLRGQDLGELVIWAALGIPLVAWIVIAYVRSSPAARKITQRVAIPFVGLLFFAVATDLLLILAVGGEWSGRALYLVQLTEISGELLCLTLAVLVPCFFLLRHRLTARTSAPALAASPTPRLVPGT